jgi:hypothetical protein
MIAWVHPAAHRQFKGRSDVQSVFGQKTNPPLAFKLALGTNSRTQMRSIHAGWDTGFSSGSSVVERDTWQHLAWVFGPDQQMTFVKNAQIVPVAQQADTRLSALEHRSEITIGMSTVADPGRFNFVGYLDDVRIYQGNLSLSEI